VTSVLTVGVDQTLFRNRRKMAQQFEGHNHKLVLEYWSGRGLAEVPRTLFALNGKFPPADYQDWRASGAPAAHLPNVAENLGRMPVFYDNGHIIGQSGAIWRHVARINNLYGADVYEAGRIDSIVETVKELSDAFSRLIPYGNTFDDAKKQEIRDAWFTSPVPTKREEPRHLLWYLQFLEKVVGADGFAVGGKVSLADAVIYNKFGEDASEVKGGGPFGDAAAMAKVLESYPKLQKIVATFRANPNIQKWLAQRGPQGF